MLNPDPDDPDEDEDSDMSWLGTSPDSNESLEDDLDRDVVDDVNDDDLDVEEHDEDDPGSMDTDDEDQVSSSLTTFYVDCIKKLDHFMIGYVIGLNGKTTKSRP